MNQTSTSEILDITTDMLVSTHTSNVHLDITPDMLVVGQEKLHVGDMEQDFSYFNPFAIGLSIILIGVFIIQYIQGFPEGMSIDLNNFTYKYAAYGDSQNPIGIFTSMFLHGGLDHILGNLVFLYILSLPIYRLTGFFGTSGIFLVAGMAGGSLSYHFGSLPSVGASGGIFGLFGYIAVYYLLKKEELSENLKDLSWVMIIAVILQIFSGLTVDYIDNFAHFGGCLIGMSLAYWQYGILRKKKILA